MSSNPPTHFKFGNNLFEKSYVKRVFMVQNIQTKWYVVCVEGHDECTFTISYKNKSDAEDQMAMLNGMLTGGVYSFYFEENTNEIIYTTQFDKEGNKVADASGGLVADVNVDNANSTKQEESKTM